MDNTQNVISFCTGYGGLELGIRRAGVDIRTVCNVEIEAFAQANLVAKIEEGRMDNAPIYSDLKTFPASIFRGKICGVIGGYPCQPFSSAGKRKGEEDPRHLWPYIRKHVRTIRPLWCFFENVRGHVTMGLWRVLSDLEEDGYRTEWGLFSAEETAKESNQKCLGRDLNQMENWPTPRAGNPGSRKPGTGGKILAEEAKNWGTPASNDANKTPHCEINSKQAGLSKSVGIEEAKKHNGPPAPEKSSTSGKNHGSPKLNPNWVEQLMGLEVGWTQLPTEWIVSDS